MAEGGVDIGMDDLGREEEKTEDGEDTGETSFTDGNQRRRLDYLTDSPVLDSDDVIRVTPDEGVPNAGRDSGAMKRSLIEGKKKIFREERDLGFTVNVGDGKASRELIEQTKFDLDDDDKPVNATFRGKLVMVSKKGGGIRLSKSRKNDKYIEAFEGVIREARAEHSKTLAGAIEKVNNDSTTPQEVVDDISSRVVSESERTLEEREEDLRELARGVFLDETEVREFIGMLDPKGTSVEKIRALGIEARHYRDKADNEADPRREQLFEAFVEVAEMKADTIRIRIGDAPQHIDVISVLENEVENNDLNRLERFKRWAKGNLFGLSVIAVTIAGIITTVVVAARKVVSGGAKAVGGFAKALANLGKKLGPLLAPLFSLIAKVLTLGSKGVAWLANNLWVLAVAMAWFLYDRWKNRKTKSVK